MGGGFRHSIVCTAQLEVFGFGNNRYGELGLGHTKNQKQPTALVSLSGQSVGVVACGEFHTMIVLKNGEVYGFGYNGSGQLGLGHKENTSIPQRVPVLSNRAANGDKITSVSCGYYHTVCITGDGDLWVCGYNANGMLGLGHTTEIAMPERHPTLHGKRLQLASLCRSHHTLVFKGGEDEGPAKVLQRLLPLARTLGTAANEAEGGSASKGAEVGAEAGSEAGAEAGAGEAGADKVNPSRSQDRPRLLPFSPGGSDQAPPLHSSSVAPLASPPEALQVRAQIIECLLRAAEPKTNVDDFQELLQVMLGPQLTGSGAGGARKAAEEGVGGAGDGAGDAGAGVGAGAGAGGDDRSNSSSSFDGDTGGAAAGAAAAEEEETLSEADEWAWDKTLAAAVQEQLAGSSAQQQTRLLDAKQEATNLKAKEIEYRQAISKSEQRVTLIHRQVDFEWQ
jgi:hypothetical protein